MKFDEFENIITKNDSTDHTMFLMFYFQPKVQNSLFPIF